MLRGRHAIGPDILNLSQYLFDMADGFPLSPHFFHVKEKEGFDWLARTHTHVGVRYSIYWLY